MRVMTVAAIPRSSPSPRRHFDNAAELVSALGDVPLDRIILDPPPGMATEADLLKYVERDNRLCELIDGTLVEKRLGYFESRVAINLVMVLGPYVETNALGAVTGADSTLRMPSTGHIRLPDVAFVCSERVPKTWIAVPTLAPDLAVEVLSDGNTKAEMAQKLREYFDSGSRLVWIINPRNRTVSVYHSADAMPTVLNEADRLDGEDVVPGFTMAVAALFAGLPAWQE